MMLASRSRSNRAVVSERSTVCVSSISLTLEVAVSLRARDCLLRDIVELGHRAVDGAGRRLARAVDHARNFGAVVHHRARKGEALLFDRLDGMVGRVGHFARKMVAPFR